MCAAELGGRLGSTIPDQTRAPLVQGGPKSGDFFGQESAEDILLGFLALGNKAPLEIFDELDKVHYFVQYDILSRYHH